MSQPILEAQNLVKRFGDVIAVAGVDIALYSGECLGLLGENGAGKTTTIEMLENLQDPSEGEVRYKGAPLPSNFAERIGVMFQATALPDKLTVLETLTLFRSLYPSAASLDELIARCDLGDLLGQEPKTLSGGQRQRVLLALALVNQPEILFLDEPTAGLDPSARRRLWEIVKQLRAEGVAILLTTHYMEEAELLCDRIAIMQSGRVVNQGRTHELLSRYTQERIVELPRRVMSQLPEGTQYSEQGDWLEIVVPDLNVALGRWLDAGIDLRQMTIRAVSLEDVFLMHFSDQAAEAGDE
ncbi:MAG: ABC transporter ATP-binding protein [Gammaproteobacteria bacterium]|nr:ABC transporter ATP-binding protein [Gammaproteobacteria bacterium]